MKHAVVTGGAGFLGSHLCDTLLEHSYRVTCIDKIYFDKDGKILPVKITNEGVAARKIK